MELAITSSQKCVTFLAFDFVYCQPFNFSPDMYISWDLL